jgi:hypothetical protein
MEIFGFGELVDGPKLLELFVRLGLDLAMAFIVIQVVYSRLYRNREYIFTYYLFNVITFVLCLVLRQIPIELGFALGLFAVFGILRYRTEPIGIRNLTYLFIVIGIAIVNSVANGTISVAELLTVNGVIVGLTATLELSSASRNLMSTPMIYDKLLLLRPGSEATLRADLRERTGLDVVRVEVNRLDMLRDAAEINVYYLGATR